MKIDNLISWRKYYSSSFISLSSSESDLEEEDDDSVWSKTRCSDKIEVSRLIDRNIFKFNNIVNIKINHVINDSICIYVTHWLEYKRILIEYYFPFNVSHFIDFKNLTPRLYTHLILTDKKINAKFGAPRNWSAKNVIYW